MASSTGVSKLYADGVLVGRVSGDLDILVDLDKGLRAWERAHEGRRVILVSCAASARAVTVAASHFPLASELFDMSPEVAAPYKYNREESWRRQGKRRGRR